MLPFSYVLRNLWRRRGRTAATLLGVGVISLLVVLMGGFARGLEETAAQTASDDVLVVVGSSGEHDLIRSVISRNNAEAVAAYVDREIEIIDGIKRGLAEVKAGRVVPHDQVVADARRIITDVKGARAKSARAKSARKKTTGP